MIERLGQRLAELYYPGPGRKRRIFEQFATGREEIAPTEFGLD